LVGLGSHPPSNTYESEREGEREGESLIRVMYSFRYGMGLTYLKMGKLNYAEHHFRRATEINPTNAVLLSCIGMVRTSHLPFSLVATFSFLAFLTLGIGVGKIRR
jgi:hypothetical protein